MRLIAEKFAGHGYEQPQTLDLDSRNKPSYTWPTLTKFMRTEAIWFEAHGNGDTGLEALDLHRVADFVASDEEDAWQPASAELFVFGSCYTANAGIFDLMQVLSDRECVVVASSELLRFSDGPRLYPELIDTWVRDSDAGVSLPERAANLDALWSGKRKPLLTARYVNPHDPIRQLPRPYGRGLRLQPGMVGLRLAG